MNPQIDQGEIDAAIDALFGIADDLLEQINGAVAAGQRNITMSEREVRDLVVRMRWNLGELRFHADPENSVIRQLCGDTGWTEEDAASFWGDDDSP
jgi:hypothetical protein